MSEGKRERAVQLARELFERTSGSADHGDRAADLVDAIIEAAREKQPTEHEAAVAKGRGRK